MSKQQTAFKTARYVNDWLAKQIILGKSLPSFVDPSDWNSDDYGDADLRVMCAPCGRRV
jgi:hypothetical protein